MTGAMTGAKPVVEPRRVQTAMIYQRAAAEADQKIANTLDQRIGSTRDEPRADARDRGSQARQWHARIVVMITFWCFA